MKLIAQKAVDGFMRVVQPVADILIGWNVHPNTVTAVGFVFSVAVGVQFYVGNFVAAGVLLILSGVCDVLDGKLARSTNNTSTYGALFDSSIDRYSEFFIFAGLAAHYHQSKGMVALLIVTLAGSVMTSYVRARAEGLGIACKVGIMQRPERLTYLAAGAMLSVFWKGVMILAIVIVAVFSNITAIQRISHTYKEAR